MDIENLETQEVQETRKPLKMNLQFFAEPGAGTEEGNGDQSDANNTSNKDQNTEGTGNKTPDIDIDEVVSKALEKKEAAILKSLYLQQGMTEEEAKEAIADFKTKKAAEAQKESSKTNEAIKAEKERADKAEAKLRETALNTALKDAANTLGANPERLNLILKLASDDLKTVKVDENFNVDNDAVKTVIEKVLNDVPEFKLFNNKNFGAGNGSNSSKFKEDTSKMSYREKMKRLYDVK